ncbi:MAG: hypothetical protein ACRDSL_23195 [Pseudonocardiaceae bacterium]
MIALEHARQMVTRYLLNADESVVNVRPVGNTAVVDTDNWTWIVQRVPIPVTGRPLSSQWLIYDVSLDLFTDPGQHSEGFALFTDGRILRLTEKGDLNEFWNLAGPSIEAGDLAALLTRYQSDRPPAHIVQNEADLDHVVGVTVARQATNVTPPQPTFDESGSLSALNFYTWYVATNPGGRADTITVDNWQVHVHKSGNLSWTVTTVAQDLPWAIGR